ncbi:MAG: quinone-dependent dihydroorotate dehydrogenase, partial [Nanoarchaeota archaeon]|nr:quinone-dependent dihydroorotate dehydrogenase [Nanoarchaeota archaeon]
PVGLAAGFDKNGKICEFIESLGFGFMEVGSVTYNGGKGNPRPRILRLPNDYALINRMGLNNQGAYEVRKNLKLRKSKFPVGVNLAKTHSPDIVGDAGIKDFIRNYFAMSLLNAATFYVLNISCPNTVEGKTFEEPSILKEFLSAISPEINRVYVKLSPDLTDFALDEILQVTEDAGVTGYVISNTSADRNNLSELSRKISKEFGLGGLSGPPIKNVSTEMVRKVFKKTRKTIFGVGGIFTAEDAYEKMQAGASLVEVLTGMIYEGSTIAREINKGLVRLMERDGVKNLSEVVGAAV